MISPCPKCGATKTDPVPHNFRYELARVFGYRLQRCSRCRKARYLPRHHRINRDSSPAGKESMKQGGFAQDPVTLMRSEAPPAPQEDHGEVGETSERGGPQCPACGSIRYHQTHRTRMEWLLRRPALARCENCGLRFPYPGRRAKDPEALEVVAIVPRSAEEEKASKMTKEKTQVQALKQEFPADAPYSDLPRCPACGSNKHHRTERNTLERVLGRPPMARCEKCGKRFPYSKSRVESHDSKKSGPTPASKGRVRGERSGSGNMEGTAQPNDDKAGPIADSSEEGSSRCPFCGSTSYRRSRRSAAERLLLRPKMARCSHCRKRFPLPLR
jgi:hypothetical protein